MRLEEWIEQKLADIAAKLPTVIHQDAASFSCGFNLGYKTALLDLENFLDEVYERLQTEI